ncbi:MAG TPA: bifunctional folylpolyglutamate synthase/dihydrofolate synthase [Myxococcales bacterium]|nr:bifunctional folylpolyglutamate synthase/dihydrofolate synthase [Myxococcales bacterium]
MSLPEALRYLSSLSRFGMRFGLERIERLLEALEHPERAYRVLHVAGTNGKGSTCAFAASVLEQAGLRVGLYTSPHLVRFHERIRVAGAEICDEALVEGVEALKVAAARAKLGDEPLTFFEATTALALRHFAREKVEVVVLETGLGGRLDATNAVGSQVCAITRIGLDHTALLGSTLGAVAAEKAGIIKAGCQPVFARQAPEALSVLERRAGEIAASARVAGRDFGLEGAGPFSFFSAGLRVENLELPLPGPHQLENAESAIEAARLLVPGIAPEAVRQGLRRTRWPGRFERAAEGPLTVLDGAHNPDGAAALARAVRALFPRARVHLVFGVLADQDVEGIARLLMPLAARVYVASPANERALAVDELEGLARRFGPGAKAYATVAEALRSARAEARAAGEGAMVLVAGSLCVVGEAAAALSGAQQVG